MDSAIDIIEKKLGIEPVENHKLVYDSSSETLEPIYFWILDFMNNMFEGKVEKLTDNFTSSPGSSHFSELGRNRAILQDQVMKTLGGVSQVIRTVVNIIYDLKDFEIRLKHYEDVNSRDKNEKGTAILALKQVWIDNVDIKRGQGSINGLTSGNLQFTTLRDAFFAASSAKDADKLDLNDRVKRILKPRLAEFEQWRKLSEEELKKRFNIEKNYLKSQVNTLKLYSKWVKPYLKGANELEMRAEGGAELVTAFNTIIFELAIFGKDEVDVEKSILSADLPKGIKKPKRKYYSVVLVDFHFRGIPGKAGQHFTFGGRSEVNFKGYTLNEEQLQAFKQENANSEISDVMKLIEGSTTESLDEIQKDIDYFLKDDKSKEKMKEADTNPFSALFSLFFKGKDKGKKEDKETKEKIINIKKIKKDSYSESLIRELAESNAREKCYTVFDIYKKSHGMASHDAPEF